MKLTVSKKLFFVTCIFILTQANLQAQKYNPNIQDSKEASTIQANFVTTEVAVLFCDLRNFSGLCEQNDPQKVMLFLNKYFANITDIVFNYGGTIDKFIGDAAMAIFSSDAASSEQSPKTACQNAVECALKIIDYTATLYLNDFALKREHGPKVHNGIGITYGKVAAGGLGSPKYYEFTVIGDTVNLANRLQNLNKDENYEKILSKNIIISDNVYENLTNPLHDKFSYLDHVLFKGKKEKLHVYGFSG